MNLKTFFLITIIFVFQSFFACYGAFPVKAANSEAKETSVVAESRAKPPISAIRSDLPELGKHNLNAHRYNFFDFARAKLKSIWGRDDNDEKDIASYAGPVVWWGVLLDAALAFAFQFSLPEFCFFLGLFSTLGIIFGVIGLSNHTDHTFKAVSGIVLGTIGILFAIGLSRINN